MKAWKVPDVVVVAEAEAISSPWYCGGGVLRACNSGKEAGGEEKLEMDA